MMTICPNTLNIMREVTLPAWLDDFIFPLWKECIAVAILI